LYEGTSPLPPNNVRKCFVDVYLLPTLKKGEGEATFHERRKENALFDGNFHGSTTFVHDCRCMGCCVWDVRLDTRLGILDASLGFGLLDYAYGMLVQAL